MCQKLFQLLACGHKKEVCITPCPHALTTAYFTPHDIYTPMDPFSDNACTQVSQTTPPRYTFSLSPISPTTIEGLPKFASSTRSRAVYNNLPSPRHRMPYTPARSAPHTSLFTEHTPNYCPYFFSRYLSPSHTPCLQCYMQPEWEQLRKRWLEDYSMNHIGTKKEDLVRLAGVEEIPERVGLLNVMREMERMGSDREKGSKQ